MLLLDSLYIVDLETLRHDTAHVLAQAVKQLFPETQITIGPSIENGFYYDFFRKESFSLDDLKIIEERMHEIVEQDLPFIKEIWKRHEAISFFEKTGETFKVELIKGIAEGEPISLYRQGDFIDLCRGPHFASTKSVGHAFKLTKIAGAYWRGNSKNPMLQRIYGTAWFSRKDLDTYLHQQEEALKRDHRKLGQDLSLFHIQEEAKGSIFWHPKGWTLFRLLKNWVRKKIEHHGYVEVNTPILLDQSLWKASGHWDKFRSNMFVCDNGDDRTLALKPMNCPGHIQIFKQGIKSYRDLPIRMAEFGCCHRNEASGSLQGLTRVRSMTQDDAHIFCTKDQIVSETKAFCSLLKEMYKELDFDKIAICFSTRPHLRAGDDDIWDQAESALQEAADASGLLYKTNPGEGAFYGPKLEFHLTDALGRSWQCGTLQVDFVLPERLDATYIGEDGQKYRPVMLHRAILGSLERFIGILIEHYAGNFPVWLSPVQAVITPITLDIHPYANQLFTSLQDHGVRVNLDDRNEKITYKIREHSLQKIPFILVVGKKEENERTISVRTLGSNQQVSMTLDQFVQKVQC